MSDYAFKLILVCGGGFLLFFHTNLVYELNSCIQSLNGRIVALERKITHLEIIQTNSAQSSSFDHSMFQHNEICPSMDEEQEQEQEHHIVKEQEQEQHIVEEKKQEQHIVEEKKQEQHIVEEKEMHSCIDWLVCE